MLTRFQDKRVRVEAVEQQACVAHNRTFAEQLDAVGKLEEWSPGAEIIKQEATDRDLFLILLGEFSIIINGREMARRGPNQHAGEMALIDHRALRSATVVARVPSVTLRISEPDFAKFADENPRAWRCLAAELGERLRQRSRFVRSVNSTPIVFLGSSSESRSIVEAIHVELSHDPFIVRPWTLGVFGPSNFPIEDLQKQVKESDFAILVIGPDDKVTSRGSKVLAPRDNVVFELGLFMGALERERTFIVQERGRDLKIPSDLLGLGTIRFAGATPTAMSRIFCFLGGGRSAAPPALAVRIVEACDVIREKVRELGSR